MELKNALITFGIICLCFFGIPIRVKKADTDKQLLFETFITKFNKSYSHNDTEYQIRFENFKASLNLIEELNANRTSKESARYGLSQYSDLSKEEFSTRHLQHNSSNHHNHTRNIHKYVSRRKRAIGALPAKVDWRSQGVIGSIRNQKTCGACWAFSTIETVESMVAIKTGKLPTLSVQEAIDCAGSGNFGCEGGDTCSLLSWLTSSQTKIQPESNYPFVYQTQTCQLKPSTAGVQVASNYTCDYLVNNEQQILSTLANHGPVAVAVNAINWQYYLGGVIQFHCSGALTDLNHAVQLVGYDQTTDIPHYIARNSWGTTFGDNGYLYIAFGTNVCGVANEVSALDVV